MYVPLNLSSLNSTGVLEQGVELSLLGLQIAVSTNMLLGNEDVGHGGLARHFAEGGLDCGAVVYTTHAVSIQPFSFHKTLSVIRGREDRAMKSEATGAIHTDLIQLNRIELCPALTQELLRGFAVWAVGF